MRSRYDEVYRRVACATRRASGRAAAEDIHWDRRWDRVLDDSRPPYYRWFAGGVLNTCYNALDRPRRPRPRQAARADLRQSR